MVNRRIIIGDVHGHYDGLVHLLEAIAPDSDDQIYFLGDLIDRGPHSAQVVQLVMDNQYPCLRGNHEEMLLQAVSSKGVSSDIFQTWLYSGGHATLTSYGDQIPPDHLNWLQSLPLYLDLGDVWLVHAGINPNLPLSQQTARQFCWIKEEFHTMREPYFPNKLIIAGHTLTFTLPGVKPGNIAAGPGWLNLETGAYHPHSGWLTGLDLSQNQVYQFNCQSHRLRILPLEAAVTNIKPSSVRRNLGKPPSS